MPQQVSKPRGPADMICPLHRLPMVEVCDKCPLWVHVLGKHPQSEQTIDHWDCAFAWTPLLLIENSQQQRQTGAAVESFRNEMVHANEAARDMLARTAGGPKLINGK
jgi:hypothetical protein